jgi:hypothetical protein
MDNAPFLPSPVSDEDWLKRASIQAQLVIDELNQCPKCLGSGLIFVSVNAWGDRISEICKCPAGDSDRRFVDMSERQIARDERARDIGSDEEFNW